MKIQEVKQTIIPILKKHGVIRASLFGSLVRGEMKKRSDIDILVELPKKITGFDYIGLRMDLQEDLEKALKKKVDVVEYDGIKPALKKYILPEQIPIFSS